MLCRFKISTLIFSLFVLLPACSSKAPIKQSALHKASILASANKKTDLVEASFIDGIAYQVNDDIVLQSDLDKAKLFFDIQAKLSKTKMAVDADFLHQFVIEYSLQKHLCDKFGIDVTDEQMLQNLSQIAKAENTSLFALQQTINSIQPNAYKIFYDLQKQQMRFYQLRIMAARQEINIGDQEVNKHLNKEITWLVTVQYVLLFAENETAEAKEKITQALELQDADLTALKNLTNNKTMRHIVYKQTPLAKLPQLIGDNLPNKTNTIRSFSNDSGTHWVKLTDKSPLTNSGDKQIDVEAKKLAIKNKIFKDRFPQAVKIWLSKLKNKAYIKKL